MEARSVSFEEPFQRFQAWMKEAEVGEVNDPNAMALATVAADGRPSIRMVLLKGMDEQGFVFYTNFESRKGQELLATQKASILFHWKSLRRQIRIEGRVEKVSDTEADAYFNSRPRSSRIGAWASDQSRPMESRLAFEKRIATFTAKFGVGDVPRPPHWSGFRLVPDRFEFWKDKRFRLHEREQFDLKDGAWAVSILYP